MEKLKTVLVLFSGGGARTKFGPTIYSTRMGGGGGGSQTILDGFGETRLLESESPTVV